MVLDPTELIDIANQPALEMDRDALDTLACIFIEDGKQFNGFTSLLTYLLLQRPDEQ